MHWLYLIYLFKRTCNVIYIEINLEYFQQESNPTSSKEEEKTIEVHESSSSTKNEDISTQSQDAASCSSDQSNTKTGQIRFYSFCIKC